MNSYWLIGAFTLVTQLFVFSAGCIGGCATPPSNAGSSATSPSIICRIFTMRYGASRITMAWKSRTHRRFVSLN